MHVKSLITLGFVFAAFAVPVAQASNPQSYIGHPGGPGAAGPVLPEYNGTYLDRELVGGPGGAGPVLAVSRTATSDSFDWADAVIGGGFVAGIALFVAGAALMVRRRRTMAELPS